MSDKLTVKLKTAMIHEGESFGYGDEVALERDHAARMCVRGSADPVGFDINDSEFDDFRESGETADDEGKDASAPDADEGESMDADATPDDVDETADEDLEDLDDADEVSDDETATDDGDDVETAEG